MNIRCVCQHQHTRLFSLPRLNALGSAAAAGAKGTDTWEGERESRFRSTTHMVEAANVARVVYQACQVLVRAPSTCSACSLCAASSGCAKHRVRLQRRRKLEMGFMTNDANEEDIVFFPPPCGYVPTYCRAFTAGLGSVRKKKDDRDRRGWYPRGGGEAAFDGNLDDNRIIVIVSVFIFQESYLW